MTPMAKLVAAARRARRAAYAPYSRFKVGAAVEDSRGRIHSGCNVENVSFGLTICAERVALFKATSEGARKIRRVAVVAGGPGLPFPCGACRQVLQELAPEAEVALAGPSGPAVVRRVSELLPEPFLAFRGPRGKRRRKRG